MTHDIDSIRKQIATLTAALDALEGKNKAPSAPAKVWFDGFVEFEVDTPNDSDCEFSNSIGVDGSFAVDLDILNYALRPTAGKKHVVYIHGFDDDDLIKIVRDKNPWIPSDADVVDSSFTLQTERNDTLGRQVVNAR